MSSDPRAALIDELGRAVVRFQDATQRYDEAVGEMTKREDGEMWVSRVVLRPQITYEGRRPTPAEAEAMHEKAHHMCFIANSVKTEIVVEEVEPVSG